MSANPSSPGTIHVIVVVIAAHAPGRRRAIADEDVGRRPARPRPGPRRPAPPPRGPRGWCRTPCARTRRARRTRRAAASRGNVDVASGTTSTAYGSRYTCCDQRKTEHVPTLPRALATTSARPARRAAARPASRRRRTRATGQRGGRRPAGTAASAGSARRAGGPARTSGSTSRRRRAWSPTPSTASAPSVDGRRVVELAVGQRRVDEVGRDDDERRQDRRERRPEEPLVRLEHRVEQHRDAVHRHLDREDRDEVLQQVAARRRRAVGPRRGDRARCRPRAAAPSGTRTSSVQPNVADVIASTSLRSARDTGSGQHGDQRARERTAGGDLEQHVRQRVRGVVDAADAPRRRTRAPGPGSAPNPSTRLRTVTAAIIAAAPPSPASVRRAAGLTRTGPPAGRRAADPSASISRSTGVRSITRVKLTFSLADGQRRRRPRARRAGPVAGRSSTTAVPSVAPSAFAPPSPSMSRLGQVLVDRGADDAEHRGRPPRRRHPVRGPAGRRRASPP